MSIKGFRPTVVITAGGTTEAIDNVRCMTNVSTGATGARIAECFLANGWEVIYIHGQGAEMPSVGSILAPGMLGTYEAVTAQNMLDMVERHSKRTDAVIMSAAVSDFTFDLDGDVKLDSSDSLGFINYLRDTIRPNVKILPQIRKFNPDAYIVGFKYTVGATDEQRRAIASSQMISAGINATFVNDDVEMREKGRCGMLYRSGYGVGVKYTGRENIAGGIYNAVLSQVINRAMDEIPKMFSEVMISEV